MRGWFADIDEDAPGDTQWQPCLNLESGHIPCFEVWFKTEQDCLDWIRREVIPAAGQVSA